MTQAPTTTSASAAPPITPAILAVLVSRTQWLIRLRWFYAAGMAVLGAVVFATIPLADDPLRAAGRLVALAALTAGYNLVIRWRLNHCRVHAEPAVWLRGFTNIQIALDLAILSSLLLVTGGLHNALTAVVVFHLAVAASLLPERDGYVQAAWAVVLAVAVAVCGRVGLVVSGAAETRRGLWAHTDRGLWLAAMVGVLAAVAALTVWFTNALLFRLRRTNRRLEEANRELSVLDVTKSRFLRLSSHQLRGPVAAIHSMLAAMGSVGPLNPKQAELAGRIKSRAGDIVAQTDEMLQLCTIREKGVETAQQAPQDVGEALASAVASQTDAACRRGVELEVCGPAEPACVLAWAEAIPTVLRQLLSNAIKYTPPGGQVRVRVQGRDRHVELEVCDTGIGIPANQQNQVFGEFFRATNARQVAGGTGLGLCIVQAIADRLGGQVALASTDSGTSLTVTLPGIPCDGCSPVRSGSAPPARQAPSPPPAGQNHPVSQRASSPVGTG